MLVPLKVHLVFHPSSDAARALASFIDAALNDDPALPGLAIPTCIVPEDGTGLPPLDYDLDGADHSAVVLLADDDFVLDPEDLPADRIDWPEFAARLSGKCDGHRHRFIPFQLSRAAFGFHDALRHTSFARAWAEPEETRSAWVARRLVIELYRLFVGLERGDQAPIQLFLSHAKADVGRAPKAFAAIAAHLNSTQPVKAWVDSAEIEAGSSFVDRITKGAEDSAVLAIVTTEYSSRPWCRKEILLAKEKQRPLVVVDALSDLDRRAFPYLGNVPTLEWTDGAAGRAVDLLLKEALRHAHARRTLARHAGLGDVVLATPPELLTVTSLPEHASVLYPDPPIDDEEQRLIQAVGRTASTPLQRVANGQRFAGRKIALSISESADAAAYGMLPRRLDAAMLDVSRHLLAGGAILAYGGHLGSSGYTTALFDLRDAHAESLALARTDRIVNYVGWPLPYKQMKKEDRARLERHLRFRRVGRPDGVEDLEPATFVEEPAFFPADSPERRYAWAMGMSRMRHVQTAETDARVLLGGKVGPTMSAQPDGTQRQVWYASRVPGVLEEALLSLRAVHPHRVYVLGAWGGASAALAELLLGGDRADLTWAYQRGAPHAEAMRGLYTSRGVPFEDYAEMKAWLRDFGVAGLSANNRLTPDENRELFWSSDIFRVVKLLIQGLSR